MVEQRRLVGRSPAAKSKSPGRKVFRRAAAAVICASALSLLFVAKFCSSETTPGQRISQDSGRLGHPAGESPSRVSDESSEAASGLPPRRRPIRKTIPTVDGILQRLPESLSCERDSPRLDYEPFDFMDECDPLSIVLADERGAGHRAPASMLNSIAGLTDSELVELLSSLDSRGLTYYSESEGFAMLRSSHYLNEANLPMDRHYPRDCLLRLCEANEFASIAMDVLIERITARAGQDGGISALVGTVPDNLVGEFFRMLVFSHMGDSPDSFAPGDTLELLLSLDDRQLSHFMRELSIFTAVNNMMPNDQDNPYQINIQSLLDMIESDSSERHSSIFESLTGMSVSADRHRQNADRILSW